LCNFWFVRSIVLDVLSLLAEEAFLLWVKALLLSTEDGPVRGPGHVVEGSEGAGAIARNMLTHQLMESVIVDPSHPGAIYLELYEKNHTSLSMDLT